MTKMLQGNLEKEIKLDRIKKLSNIKHDVVCKFCGEPLETGVDKNTLEPACCNKALEEFNKPLHEQTGECPKECKMNMPNIRGSGVRKG